MQNKRGEVTSESEENGKREICIAPVLLRTSPNRETLSLSVSTVVSLATGSSWVRGGHSSECTDSGRVCSGLELDGSSLLHALEALKPEVLRARLLIGGCFTGWVAYLDGVLGLEFLDTFCLVLCNAACCRACTVRTLLEAATSGRTGTSRVSVALSLGFATLSMLSGNSSRSDSMISG